MKLNHSKPNSFGKLTSDNKEKALNAALNAKKSLQGYRLKSEIKNNISSREKIMADSDTKAWALQIAVIQKASPFIGDIIVKPQFSARFCQN